MNKINAQYASIISSAIISNFELNGFPLDQSTDFEDAVDLIASTFLKPDSSNSKQEKIDKAFGAQMLRPSCEAMRCSKQTPSLYNEIRSDLIQMLPGDELVEE